MLVVHPLGNGLAGVKPVLQRPVAGMRVCAAAAAENSSAQSVSSIVLLLHLTAALPHRSRLSAGSGRLKRRLRPRLAALQSYFTTTSPKPVALVVCPTPSTAFGPRDALDGMMIAELLVPAPLAVAVPSNWRGSSQ